MEKRFLKKLRDNLPEPVKKVMGPVFRRVLVDNKLFQDTYNKLLKREKLSRDEIEQTRFNKLKNMLQYASAHVPYYTKLFREAGFDPARITYADEMTKIPFLTRELIRENYNDLISTEMVKGGFYVATTGGSSGLPLQFLLDYHSVYQEYAFIYYYRRKLGFGFKHRVATFRGVDFDSKLWKLNPMFNELLLSPVRLSRKTIREYVKKLEDYQPDYINGYCSALWFFARLMQEENIVPSISLRGIFFQSEDVDPGQREFIEKFFGVPSISHYGMSERCILAEEKSPGKYYFDPYYGFTELVPSGNEEFSIVGTGFLTHTMPLIRYKTDDQCNSFGDGYLIRGKRSSREGIYGYNGEFMSASSFDLEDEEFKNIMRYQLIQKERGKADLLIVVNEKFNDKDMEIVTNALKNKTRGVVDFKLQVVENLTLSPRGKFQMYKVDIKD